VVVEKATGTVLEGDGTQHKRVAFVALKSWFSLDKKYLLYPRKILNPIKTPKWITADFFQLKDKMTDSEMNSRHVLVPFPLSEGQFYEIDMKGMNEQSIIYTFR
jgi:hypothetical protein